MTKYTDLLAQANDCLSELIESAFLDATEMSNDCLELFDTYDWEQRANLSDLETQRWDELLNKGCNGEMSSTELSEFFELTNPNGQNHAYFYRVQARKLIMSIQKYQKTLTTEPERIP